MSCPRHGVDHWELVRYSWDKKTGNTRMLYERGGGLDGNGQERVVIGNQPRWQKDRNVGAS